jgi:isopenicillin-N epimerase
MHNSRPEFISGAAVGGAQVDSTDWQEVRHRFVLRDDMIYMNCGTEGSMPRRILERYNQYNSDWAKSPSYYFFDDRKLGARAYQQANREAMGQFIGANGKDICLTNNTTMGLAFVLLGLRFNRGDEILTSDQEHWSLLSPLGVLRGRGQKIGVVPIDVPLKDPCSVVEAFKARITKRTKAIAVSHVTWSTGTQLPIQSLCELAKDQGIITVIDGAHALGALALNVAQLGCDFYAASGHKWLNGPPGTGVLYIRDAADRRDLVPIIAENIPAIGNEPISSKLQIRGCNNTAGFAAMIDAAAFANELGRDTIERRILALCAYTKRLVIATWGPGALFGPAADLPELSSGITSFVPSANVAAANGKFINALVNELWNESRIYVRSVSTPTLAQPENSRYAIRVSTNIFNSFCEVDRLIAETSRIADALGGC